MWDLCFIHKHTFNRYPPIFLNHSGIGTEAALAATPLARRLIFITCYKLQHSSLFVLAVLYTVTCVHFRLNYTVKILTVKRPLYKAN